MPRIILKDKKENIRLEISLERASLIITNDVGDKLNFSNELMEKLLNIIFDNLNWKINRLAKLSTLKVILDNSSIGYIQDKYLKEDSIKNIEQLNLHWLNKISYEDDYLNHWTKINTPEGYENNELKITVDINMIQDQDRLIPKDLAVKFFKDMNGIIENSFEEVISF